MQKSVLVFIIWKSKKLFIQPFWLRTKLLTVVARIVIKVVINVWLIQTVRYLFSLSKV